MPPNLLTQVRHALEEAEFHPADDYTSSPGLAVTQVPDGVIVKWTASHGFTALTRDQPGTSGASMQAAVQAAISGLLIQLGHTTNGPAPPGA
ncbi:hypothetical protein [Streptomyces sp. NBC_01431]|uniref:hypothetical protein n=1 Tax=Streptomyces sp. NBC_01431 TaxID=2903863 RepID=UPI002E318735|nr:hypothetical protein [Streptomyces sp. NBC_01431]